MLKLTDFAEIDWREKTLQVSLDLKPTLGTKISVFKQGGGRLTRAGYCYFSPQWLGEALQSLSELCHR